jgi:hypothetical protein
MANIEYHLTDINLIFYMIVHIILLRKRSYSLVLLKNKQSYMLN